MRDNSFQKLSFSPQNTGKLHFYYSSQFVSLAFKFPC